MARHLAFISSILSVILFACSAGHLFAPPLAAQENWPQWRGENLNNICEARNLPVKFGLEENLKWRFELPGPAGASPIVFGNNVFVTSVVEEDNDMSLFCLTLDGEVQWKTTLAGKNKNVRMDQANSCSASPCTDGNHVWVTSAAGHLQCFDYEGNELWTVDLQERYGKFNIQFGMSSTPILNSGVLYLQMIHGKMRDRSKNSVGFVVAINAANGAEIWSQKRKTDGYAENKHSYASPTFAVNGNEKILVTHGGDYVIGHALDDGRELWRCGGLNPKGESYNPYLRFVASPLYFDGRLIVPSAKNGPVFALNTDLDGDVTDKESTIQWKLLKGTPDVATPVLHNGIVFLARENGAMLAVDAENGEMIFQKRLFASGHRSTPIISEDKLYLVGRDGTVLVVSADRECNVLAENELDENAKSSPAAVNGHLFIRTEKALYCFGN